MTKRFGASGRSAAWRAGRRRSGPGIGGIVALDGVDLTVGRHETVGIVGESGSGKSTLARVIVRLVEPDAGEVRFEGQDVLRARGGELRRLRRRMQVVHQDPYTSLNPYRRIGDAIAEPIHVHRLEPRERVVPAVDGLLDAVGLSTRDGRRYPRELSGGQRQRVAIARALATRPELLIADEAVSALDVSVQAQIINLLDGLVRERGLALIFISHQLSVISALARRVAVMYLGRIVETGPTDVVFRAPRHPYTAALISAHPSLEAPRRGAAPALTGELPAASGMPAGCRFRTRCPIAVERCAEVDPPGRPVGPKHLSYCLRTDEVAMPGTTARLTLNGGTIR